MPRVAYGFVTTNDRSQRSESPKERYRCIAPRYRHTMSKRVKRANGLVAYVLRNGTPKRVFTTTMVKHHGAKAIDHDRDAMGRCLRVQSLRSTERHSMRVMHYGAGTTVPGTTMPTGTCSLLKCSTGHCSESTRSMEQSPKW